MSQRTHPITPPRGQGRGAAGNGTADHDGGNGATETFYHTHHGHATPERELAGVVEGLLRHLRLPWLLRHHTAGPVLAAFSTVNACLSIGLIAIFAAITQTPFVFPSLGPTAFLFFYSPTAPAAAPRNAILGQILGLASGYISLLITGYHTTSASGAVQLSWSGVLSAGIALGLTVGSMVLLNVEHPPAAATALIVAVGALRQLDHLALLLGAVFLLVVQAIVINRLAGVDYPLWNPRPLSCQPSALRDSVGGA